MAFRISILKDRKFAKGFTLLELLVVITIIAVLAAMALAISGFVQRDAAKSRARAEIKSLEAALESYKADQGDYPIGKNASATDPSTVPGPNDFLVTALMPGTGKVYFSFSKDMLNTNSGVTNVIDPFGEKYGYVYAPSNGPAGPMNGTNSFDLWSRCGTANSSQWVTNW